ncbi:hypothetical protein EZV62_007996 [Acer yangbiense]|uniref:Alpha-1,3/1,6-mannosyltransferase ALG2 n=1 Tax=Acer yangbiense TaxID=1000413 RepID=A0A5C7IC46_9ROSI|nr:hypothetical protein EZV62_007996 [Acer yangbiense]
METKRCSKLNIAIIHPDLGIGGAERLIVDAAVQLASHGHNVHVFTAHHDKKRCFEETLDGSQRTYRLPFDNNPTHESNVDASKLSMGTSYIWMLFERRELDGLVFGWSITFFKVEFVDAFGTLVVGTFPVTVYGDFLPRHIFHRLHAVCAYLRCIFIALCVLLKWSSFDVILADQVSVVIPLLKLKKSTKVLFYCHFPDLLLAQHTTLLRKIYRKPIDFVEEITTGMADMILVNSEFTGSTFANTFKHLHARGIRPAVLYPAVNVDQFGEPPSYKLNFLSINRFERKKNIDLAVSAFAMLQTLEGDVFKNHNLADVTLTIAGMSVYFWFADVFLNYYVCAWKNVYVCARKDIVFTQTSCGYDKRLRENVEYLEELKSIAESSGVSSRVNFITSCSTAERNALLSQCLCVLYTPKDEHFGIVPLEAMAAHKPVIACNSGGPVETVKNEVTGFLCDPTPREFSLAMAKLIKDPEMAKTMGEEAWQHVTESFSTKIFGQRLNQFLVDIARSKDD